MARKKTLRRESQPAQDAPLSIDEALNRAHAHWNAGQAPQAEMLCQRVLATGPDRPTRFICLV